MSTVLFIISRYGLLVDVTITTACESSFILLPIVGTEKMVTGILSQLTSLRLTR